MKRKEGIGSPPSLHTEDDSHFPGVMVQTKYEAWMDDRRVFSPTDHGRSIGRIGQRFVDCGNQLAHALILWV